MSVTGICPFFKRDRNSYITCEACRLTFLDNTMRRDFVSAFCASENYRDCALCRLCEEYYDRIKEGYADAEMLRII